MPKKGENIYKRKDKRWEARYIKGYKPDGSVQYGYCYAGSYHEAREKLNAAKADLRMGITTSPAAKQRFGFYCQEWLTLCRSRVKESTYVKYETLIRSHILPGLGDTRLSALSSVRIEAFSHGLLCEKTLSPKTIRCILMVTHAVIGYIRRQNSALLPQNIEIVYPKDGKKEMRVLTLEEQKALTAYLLCDLDDCKLGILLALFTGLRLGEICALRWGNISLAEQTLTVESTMLRLKDYDGAKRKTKILVSQPKSDTSARIIPLTDYVAELCRLRERSDPDAFVLTGEKERYMEPRTLQYRLEKYTAACGLEGVHFHVLRHTFATRCVEVGFEIKSLSEILGHTSPKFTLERYVHSSMELKRANMDKLTNIGC